MVPKKLGVKTAKELNGATICVAAGHHHRTQPRRLFPRQQDGVQAGRHREDRRAGRRLFLAAAATSTPPTASALAAARIGRASNPDDYVILPERISKEPLAPAVRHGDEEWNDIVAWIDLRADRGRGKGHHPEEPRRDGEERGPRHQAHPRRHPGHGQGARARREMGLQRDQGGRQLRRNLRPPPRPGLAAEARARATTICGPRAG